MRDPFAFLQNESRDRLLLLLLQAIVKKQGGEITLDLTDITSIEDGSALMRKVRDDGTSIVLSFARKGAEAYFLTEAAPSQPTTSRGRIVSPQAQPQQPEPRRSVVHDDLDLAMMEEERMASAAERQRRADLESRRQSGVMPWTTRQPS